MNLLRSAFGALLFVLLVAGCGRTPVPGGPCVGEACPCVFDSDCPGETPVCFDQVCLRKEDFDRCIARGVRPEACNGFDDDCDGRIDESLEDRACERAANGLVCVGNERCSGTAGYICDAISPREEACDGLDDDCDGEVDEPFRVGEDYLQVEHCGACGRDCGELIAGSLETQCVLSEQGPRCEVLRCEDGLVPSTEADRCTTLASALCAPCARDEDCASPGARCLTLAIGEQACGRDCGPDSPFGLACPPGFNCRDGQCTPDGGTCLCGPSQVGATRACTEPPACDGVQTCERMGGGFGWGACDISSARETCDGLDNDCDGGVDEDFRDDRGRYVGDEHCGVCNADCTAQFVPAVDHAIGGCLVAGDEEPACGISRCVEETVGGIAFEWVDVDGAITNGCECRRRAGNTAFDPPDLPGRPRSGHAFVDENCDGIDGVLGEAIFVSASAAPGGDGSLAAPVRTLAEGLTLARAARPPRYVLVAEGTYAETVVLANGDRLHGGYATDFASRDIERFAAVILAPTPNVAALEAVDVGAAGAAETLVSGFQIRGQDVNASPVEEQNGVETVAVRLVRAGPRLTLTGNVLRGGRAGDGGLGAGGRQGDGRQGGPGVDGERGTNGRRLNGDCAVGTVVPGGAGGNSTCGVAGRGGGNTSCPVFDFDPTPVGAQVPHRSPTANGDGAGGRHWSFDRLSGAGCGHVTESGFPSNVQDNNGLDGADGADGENGQRGRGCNQEFGRFDANGTWVAVSGLIGEAGSAGVPGGGGGGGGGTARFFRGPGDCPRHELGGTGGGGGAGGCGGAGGRGGRSGGASIAVIVTNPAGAVGPNLRDNRIERGRGGRGGAGGFGGSGGAGGRGGFGGMPTSWSGAEGGKGGDGGNGGRGGTGGGGCGGPSVGIAVVQPGATDVYTATNDFAFPTDAALGGAGGSGEGLGGSGNTGGSAQVFLTTPP